MLPSLLNWLRRFLAVAQESHHGHFRFSHALGRHTHDAQTEQAAEELVAEELEAKLAEAEDSSVSLTLLGALGATKSKMAFLSRQYPLGERLGDLIMSIIARRTAHMIPYMDMIPVVPHKAVAEVSKIGNL